MAKTKKSIWKRIGSTILAGLTAISVVTTSLGNVLTVEAATPAKLATTEQIVGRAASLLGTPYDFGRKGGSAYASGKIYSPWTYTRSDGIDCSGLVWWTLTSLGYSTSGFGVNNPVPVDTSNWLSTTGTTYASRGGGTSAITPEKRNVSTNSRHYWEKTDGSTIRPGSIVVGQNPNGTDHMWIYIGEFNNVSEVRTYIKNALAKSGASGWASYVTDSVINRTVTSTNGNCKHWRIESNGDDGVVVNNGEFGKKNSAVNITTYKITLDEATFKLKKVKTGTTKIIGTSPIANAVNQNAIYNVYDNSSCTGTPVGTITIGANGLGSITLPYATKYWVKEKISPTGYAISDKIYEVSANSTTTVEDDEATGSIIINKRSPDGDLSVANRTFEVTYVDGGEVKSATGKTDSTGKYTFDNLPVYDIDGTNKPIEFTVSEILTTTEEKTIIKPVDQKVKLNIYSTQNYSTTMTFDNYKYGDAVLNKVFIDKDGNEIAVTADIRGACTFRLIDSNGNNVVVSGSDGKYNYTGSTNVGGPVMKLDNNNKITVTDLPKDTYTWKEVTVPTGFKFASDTSFTISNKSDKTSYMYNKETSSDEVRLEFVKQIQIEGTDIADWKSSFVSADTGRWIAPVESMFKRTYFRAYLLIDGQKVYLTNIWNPTSYMINTGEFGAIYGTNRIPGAKPYEYEVDVTDTSLFTANPNNATKVYGFAHPIATFQKNLLNDLGKIVIVMTPVTLDDTKTQVINQTTGEVNRTATAYYNAFINGEVYLEEVKTADNGMGVVGDIDAPVSELINVPLTPDQIATIINDDRPIRIRVLKKDSETEVPVAGATYTIYADGDGYDRFSNKIYENGQEIASAVTDKNGYAVFENIKMFGSYGSTSSGDDGTDYLYINHFNIKETASAKNYILDTDTVLRTSGIDVLTQNDIANSLTPFVVEFEHFEDYQKGTVSAYKYDNNIKDGEAPTPLAGAKFKLFAAEKIVKPNGDIIYNNGDLIETAESGSNGEAAFQTLLPVGFKYEIQETEAPEGYNTDEINKKIVVVAWDNDIKIPHYTADFYNDHQSGSISVYKTNSKGEKKYLSGAKFALKAGENISLNDFVYEKDATIEEIITDVTEENPTGIVKFADVPVGFKYYVEEIEAPEGYILADDNDQSFDLIYNKNVKLVEKTLSFEDDAINVDFAKTDVAGNELPGARVQILKKEKVNKAEDESQEPIIVDEWVVYAKWISANTAHRINEMPAGDYQFEETAAPRGYMIATTINFTVTDKGKILIGGTESTAKSTDGTPLVAMADKANIVDFAKVDALGNELDGAHFQLLNENGEVYKEWTSSKNGANRITAIPVGKYTLHETEAPKGYYLAPDMVVEVLNVLDGDSYKVQVKVDNSVLTTISADGTPLVKIVDKPTEVWFYKLDEEGNNLPGAKLKIVDNLGNIVKEFTSDVEPYKLEGVLTAGLEYKLIEDESPGGYYLSGEVGFTVSLKGENIDIVNMEDTPIVVELSKKALTGEEELPGAKIQVIDADGNVIDEWTSTDKPHIVDYTKLIAGKSYTMHEIVPAPGYTLANDIDFEIARTNQGKIVRVMRDTPTQIEISKSSKSGSYEGKADVIGAKLQVIDKDGVVVEEWTTDGTVHTIVAKLVSGATYTLHEAYTPAKYTPAEDVTFTVSTDGTIDKVEMIDYTNDVDFAKVDVYGNEVKGATVQVLDSEGNVVDEWISTSSAHRLYGLSTGKYTFHEVKAPDGYVVATDIEFEVSTEKVDGKYKCVVKLNGVTQTATSADGTPLLEMIDDATKVWFYKLDEEGNNLTGAKLKIVDNLGNVVKEFTSDKEPYKLEGVLTAGLEYKLIEDDAPGGYYYSGEVSFTVSLNGEIDIVNMEDTPIIVELSKKALTGEDELPGAKIQVIDADGNVIDEWISTDKPHIIDHTKLLAGKSYTMHEIVPAPGYNLTSDVDFDISKTDEGKVVVLMRDTETHVEISKNSKSGSYEGSADVVGAKLQVLDAEGNIVEEWTTDGTVHSIIAKLISGNTYTLHEASTPAQYTPAEDITFTVSTDGSIDKVSMIDHSNDVDFAKVDVDGNEIEGAHVQILNEDGTLYKEWDSTKEPYRITGMPVGKYTFHETYAPDGYCIATDIEFEVVTGKVDGVYKCVVKIGGTNVTAKSSDDIPLVTMVDEATKVWFYKLDEKGNNLPGAKLKIVDNLGNVVKEFTSDVEPYKLEGVLTAGLEYKLIEDDSPGGYYLSGEVSFSVSLNGEIDIVNMEDTPIVVELSKKALTGEDELPGAKIQVIDADGNVIDEWISTDKPHIIDHTRLIAGKSYTMHEIVPADGYNLASDIDFNISKTDEGKVVVTMNDSPTHIEIYKNSDTGDYTGNADIVGAKLQIIDKNGNVVEEWITDGTVHTVIAKLISGETYTLHEAEAPKNYRFAPDVTFTVSTDGTVDKVEMFDSEETGSVKVVKHTTEDKYIEGIKFLLSGTTNTGREIALTAVTDETGIAYFNNVPVGSYVVSEDSESVMYAYTIADSQNVEVKVDEETEASFFNEEKEGTIHAVKRTEGDYNVANIKFILSGTSDSGREISIEAVTDENGDATFENVPIGTYTITEDGETVPAAYLVADPEEVTVTYAETTDVTFLNTEKTGSIHVGKRTEGNYNVSGIKFILSGVSDSGREITLEAITDENGDATFENVPIGTYTITEDGETVPAAYLVADPQEVTVSYAETTDVEFLNDEKTGSIKVQKRTEGMTDIEGIKFILSGTSDSGREIRLEAVTDKNGVATFDNVPIGTYTITEDGQSVPTGYLVADPQSVTVTYAETKDVTFINDKPEQPREETPEQPQSPGNPGTGGGMTEQEKNDKNTYLYLICAFMGLGIIATAKRKKSYFNQI
ncbi:MAG: hypothetical protein IJ571_00210 [Ruminococcus sp.]|nr:hypothetical protein [Ruminococcus sp.]